MGRLRGGLRMGLIFLFITFFTISLEGQDKFWVVFKNKPDVSFDPYTYFDTRAIERRQKLNLPLFDEKDLPVSKDYIDQIEAITGNYHKCSRWLNAITVTANEQHLEELRFLDFVSDIQPVTTVSSAANVQFNGRKSFNMTLNDKEKQLLKKQLELFDADEFQEAGLNGKGVRIAVFDGGFPRVDKSPVFEHLRNNNQIVETFDFVRNREDVYNGMAHGTMVLSCIAGMIGDQKMGLATGAEFLLARTEVKIETFAEEENWLVAAEWADRNGADIINSSLGYTYHRYFSKEMDGKTTLVSRAANIAASKGILVINAMGNDGDSYWEVLGAPADADSVISVGGIDPETNYHIYFSSFGPTADKRMKPNVCAYGEAIVADKKRVRKAFGTSFASPLVAGFAACAWQSRPELDNMEMFTELQKSASLYPYFDYAHGYGIPKASYFTDTVKQINATFDFNTVDGFVHVILTSDPDQEQTDYVYYHLKKEDGILSKYAVIVPEQKKVLSFTTGELENKTLTVHYKGFTKEFKQ